MDFSALLTSLPQLTAGNMLAGGVLLGAITYLWGKIQGVLSPVISYYMAKYTTFIELKDNHPTYYFAAIALSKLVPKTRGRFKVEGTGSTVYGINADETSDSTKNWFLLPGYGLHILKIQKHICFVRFIKRDLNQKEEGKSYEETITLWFPFGHSALIEKLIEEGRSIYIDEQKKSGKIKRYISRRDYWDYAGEIKFKNIDNIILPEEDKNTILESVEGFMGDKAWYTEHNLPYKTGFLFYGPPGTGKTSMISALAYKYKMPIYSLSLASSSSSDEELIELVRQIPEQSILVFEDIDRINMSNKDKESKKDVLSKITLSGLLNALDGLNSGEGFITIMTANKPETIDDALLRPGRIDQKILFNLPSVDCICEFITKFYKEEDCEELTLAAEKMHEYGWSMAAVQSYCLQSKLDITKTWELSNIDLFNNLLKTDYMDHIDLNKLSEKAAGISELDSLEELIDSRSEPRPFRNSSGRIRSLTRKLYR